MPILPSTFRSVTVAAPRLLARLYAIEQFLPEIGRPSSALEIGPGLGDFSAFLLTQFPEIRVLLSEVSPQAARLLSLRFAGEPRATVSSRDLLFGDVQPERFDLVVACEVFEHLAHDQEALKRVATLLSGGGHFIFSAPCHMRKWQPADVFAGHYRRYERSELQDKFAAAGLEILRQWTFGFPSFNLLQPARSLYYRSRNRSEAGTRDKQSATERSGIDRPRLLRVARWAVIAGMLPLLPIERRFWSSERGDGYLILARGKSP